MLNEKKPPANCLKGGCYWPSGCSSCGFDKNEAERRKQLPLVLCKDGLRRKIISTKTKTEKEEDANHA